MSAVTKEKNYEQVGAMREQACCKQHNLITVPI